ncbi:MAG: malonyl-CoA decarboxylase family protein [Rickettsiales bacterium]
MHIPLPEKQNIDASQLELREITWDLAKQNISSQDLTENELSKIPRNEMDPDYSLREFLVQKERVYPTNKEDLFFHRLSDVPMAESDHPSILSSNEQHANHAFGLFVPGSNRPEVVVYTQLRHTGARNEDGTTDYTKLPRGIDECRLYGGSKSKAADTIIFYSISATERTKFSGSLGQQLITRIAARLRGQTETPFFESDSAVPVLPEIKTLTTLSPVPGFNQWLAELPADQLTFNERRVLERHFTTDEETGLLKARNQSLDNPLTLKDSQELNETLKKLCLVYLNEMQPSKRGGFQPINGVEDFHVARNGALLANIHAAEDKTSQGQRYALGMMVNYLYDDFQSHAERIKNARDGVIPMAPHLQDLYRERQIKAEHEGIVVPTTSVSTGCGTGRN